MQIPLVDRSLDQSAANAINEPLEYAPVVFTPDLGVPPVSRECLKRIAYERSWRFWEYGCYAFSTVLYIGISFYNFFKMLARNREYDLWVNTALIAMGVTNLSTALMICIRRRRFHRYNKGYTTTSSLAIDSLLFVAWTCVFVAQCVIFGVAIEGSEPTIWVVSGLGCVVVQILYVAKVISRIPWVFERMYGPTVDALPEMEQRM